MCLQAYHGHVEAIQVLMNYIINLDIQDMQGILSICLYSPSHHFTMLGSDIPMSVQHFDWPEG